MTGYFVQAFIYLMAAVIAVPLAKRLGLGSVLGYLIAGVVIGPVMGMVGQETTTIQHFAEFGVVMMLFLVGMELEPKKLWEMRNRLIGLGGLQVGVTILGIMSIAMLFDHQWSVALAIGLILTLSSTAIVLQTFQEKNLGKTKGGMNAFSVLLFQDIAVIPMLAVIPLLALPELIAVNPSASNHHEKLSLVANLPSWLHAIVVIAAIGFVAVAGHFLTRPLFKYVASSGLREVFTATSLMLIIGISALMSLVGLSPALGAFLAGVILASSEFRHELESNVEPFKGLLLGLFFITVGAGIDFTVLADNIATVAAITFAVIAGKATVLYALARIFRLRDSNRWLLTLSLAQAGEFGFVLLAYSFQNSVISYELNSILSLVVAASMFLTPGLFIAFDKIILPRFAKKTNHQEADNIDEDGQVIIAGIGRFGQIIERLLRANDYQTVVLDQDLTQIENVRRVGIKSYFGNATLPDLIHTAGIEKASLFVVAIDQRDASVALVRYIKHTYPHIRILARAFDRGHYHEIRNAGADWIVKETFHSALEMGAEALRSLGVHPFRTEQLKTAFIEREIAHSEDLYTAWKSIESDEYVSQKYTELFLKMEESIAEAMKYNPADRHTRNERGWTPPPKGYADTIASEFDKGKP